jgi:hypothetical protein
MTTKEAPEYLKAPRNHHLQTGRTGKEGIKKIKKLSICVCKLS